MNISFNWLSQYIDHGFTNVELAEALTNVGLEVEEHYSYSTIKGSLEGIVIGEVIEVIPHPNADKLKLTKVNIGNGTLLNIVCGAPNVSQGQKVVVATEGTTLYPFKGEPFK